MTELDAILQRAERLWWGGDAAAALELLRPHAERPDLSAQGRVLYLLVLRAAGFAEEARAGALGLVRVDKTQLAAWEILLFAAMGKPEFDALLPGFLEALREVAVIDRRSLCRPLVLALVLAHPADAPDLARKAAAGGVLSVAQEDMICRATGFLHKLADGLARHKGVVESWSFGIDGSDGVFAVSGGHGRVDLSWFRLGQEEGWTKEAADALARAIVTHLPADRFEDTDAGQISGPHLTEADHLPAMLLSPLLDLPRATQGQDPDVRHAGRPMRLPQGALVLRAGWIEAWTMAGWARDRDGALQAAEEASRQADKAIAARVPFRDTTPIWPRRDLLGNAIYLTTNAGWYAGPETAAACFDDWASRYAAALQAGDLIVDCAEVLQRLATHMPGLRQKPLHDWSDGAFLQAIRGKRVVFATPFWREVAAHWSSGGLRRLWERAGLAPELEALETVAAPVSIWPHRPDADWSASFAALKGACQAAVSGIRAEVFIASCGCYGLPLVHAIHGANPGLTGLYYGHATNAWFGVLTNDAATHSLYRAAPDPALWTSRNLDDSFPGMARIDDGRYVLDAPGGG